MKRMPYFSKLSWIFLVFVITSTTRAETLSGRVYEGEYLTEPPTAQGLADVSVKLYGSHSSGTLGDQVASYTTGSDGWYGLETEQNYEYFTIVCEGKSGYTFQDSSSVGGSASGEQIQYSVPLAGKTLTGNKFWYLGETPPPSNNPPIAQDDSATTTEGTAVDIDVLFNDNDPDSDPLHVNSATDPPHGTTVNHGTHVTYTPDSGFTGTDSFDYTAGDGKGGTDTATVTVTVQEGGEPTSNNPPVANDDVVTAVEGPGDINVLINDNDPDGDPLQIISVTNPANGTAVINGNWIRYTPDPGFKGTDTFDYTISDGKGGTDTATVTITFVSPGTGALEGHKFDADTGEGLENWRIFIDLNGNGEWDSDEPSDLTDENGYYKIIDLEGGTYRVCEQMQEGWEPASGAACVEGVTILIMSVKTQDFYNRRTEGPTGGVIFTGIKYNDLNDNGNKDPDEPKLPGWEITLEDGDHNLLATTTTGADGRYSFTITEPGTYIIDEVQQPGWRQTDPVNPDGTPALRWWMLSELPPYYVCDNINFGNHQEGTEPPEGTGSIRGVKFNDLNGNGQKDPGEPGLSGWKIFLDLNDNSSLDEGEPQTTTDSNGNYAFTNLEAGVYRIHEVNQPGWRQTDPATDGVPGYWLIDLEEGREETDIDFGNELQCPFGIVLATKIDDANASPLPGWRIYQDLNDNGIWDAGEPNGVTDANGRAGICTVEVDGDYVYREVMQPGWVQIYPGPPSYAHRSSSPLSLIWPEGGYISFRNRREEAPQGTYYTSNACFNIEITAPTGTVEKLTLTGPMTQRVYVGPNGLASDKGGNGLDDVITELVSLNLSGVSSYGPITISLNTNTPSIGQIEERANNTPGILDIPPFTPTGDADSFFDVFLQIEVGGTVLLTNQPIRLTSIITHIPPLEGYSDISQTKVELLDQNGQSTGFYFGPMTSCQEAPPEGNGGSVVVIKEATPVDDTPFLFCANFSPGGFFDTLCENLKDPSNNTWTFNNPTLLQKISETVTAGWTLTDITITGDTDNGSTVDLANATVDVDYDEGENIVITFKNEKTGEAPYDHGDAPQPYPDFSLLVCSWCYLGSSVDGDTTMQRDPHALGDDNDGNNDEDGVDFFTPLIPDQQASIRIDMTHVTSSYYISGYIDFDQNDNWDANECIIQTGLNMAGIINTLTFPVPATAVTGSTFARFYITAPGPESSLPTYGEVEDYEIFIGEGGPYPPTVTGEYDFGDAPDSFGTLKNNGGPYHDVGQVMLGSSVDAEMDGQPGPLADGDNDDGIWFTVPYIGQPMDIIIVVTAPSGVLTGIEGWIDYDQSLTFESGELAVSTYFVGTGAPGFKLETIQIPADAAPGWTYARFRIHNKDIAAGGLSPTGYGGEGEVEDYRINIGQEGTPMPPGGIVSGYKFNDLNGDGFWDLNEPAIPGWTIWLDINQNGVEDAGDMYEQTDNTGHFRFVGVPTGNFTLGEQQQAGWTQKAPTGGTLIVTSDPNLPSPSVLFGNQQTGGPTFDGHICGSKWNDLNGDGVPDANEPFLAGWNIYLDINHNGRCEPGEPSQLTNATGSFEFTGLAVGSYTVAEEMLPGWKQTWPGGTETHIISVPTGPVQPACVMFGNQQTGEGLPLDWGDAPDPNYPTLRASNGAYHVIVPGIFLGGGVDAEPDGLPSLDARGDDNNGSGDEDGIFFITPVIPGQQAEVEVAASSAGYIDAWIDFDADGSWSQSSDQIFQSEAVIAGSNILNFQVPAGIAIDIDTYARFRFSSAGGLSQDGSAQDGEVEDYHILLGENGPYVPGEGQVPHVKWSQPPIEIDPNMDAPPVFCGWNEPARSTEQSGSKRQWRMDADDFRCLGPIPVTGIRWWGGYKAWTQPEPPELQPETWHIGIWANQVEGITQDESFPERLVWSVEVPNERVHRAPAGITEFPQEPGETCFVYEVKLEPEEWFHQTEFESNYDVFWISITAVYPADAKAVNQWGWATRPHIWGRGAVMPAIIGDWPTFDERLFPGRIYPIENSLLCGQNQPFDLCFELLTEPTWVKWNQPFTGIREWPEYEDVKSMALEQDGGELLMSSQVVDDWVCKNGNPITAVVWNGSYIGYGYEACKCDDVPGPRKPDYFLLSVRANSPGFAWAKPGYAEATPGADAESDSYPGEKIWEFRAEDYDEVLVGYDRNPEGEPNEPVFRYSVRLPVDARFRQEAPETIYWFSVVAVYRGSAEEIPYDWGWTNHNRTFGGPAMSLNSDTAAISQWQSVFDSTASPVDMSFIFFTEPEP